MKRFLKYMCAVLVAISMTALPLTASPDHRGGGGHQSHSSGQGHNPGGNGGRSGNHGGGSSHRPGGSKPGNGNGHGGGQRPGNGGGHNNGGHNGGGNRPGNSGHRPSGNPGHNNGGHRPGGNPGHRPGGHPGNGHAYGHRPHYRPVYHGHHHTHRIPFFGRYYRPVPPPAWRPVVYGPSFNTILGITFGTAFNISLQTLVNDGYAISSYGDDVVYLTNVPQMNYYWPDAALYYTNGRLAGSTFTYPTTVYDLSRYNSLYTTFYNQYGAPVTTVNNGGVISATWFGNNNRYVTLEFNSNYGGYYTTLSYGM